MNVFFFKYHSLPHQSALLLYIQIYSNIVSRIFSHIVSRCSWSMEVTGSHVKSLEVFTLCSPLGRRMSVWQTQPCDGAFQQGHVSHGTLNHGVCNKSRTTDPKDNPPATLSKAWEDSDRSVSVQFLTLGIRDVKCLRPAFLSEIGPMVLKLILALR